jgi:hypothetical protein
LSDDQLLKVLRFQLDARAPFRSSHRPPPAALRSSIRGGTSQFPRLLVKVGVWHALYPRFLECCLPCTTTQRSMA